MYCSKENFVSPLYLACAKENETVRPILSYVHFKNGFAYATNAHVLVKQSLADYCQVVDKELLEGKMLHRDVFQKILKADKVTAKNDCVECEFIKEKSTQIFKYGDCEGIVPDFEAVMPTTKKEFSVVGMNPSKIEQACKCLYSDDYKRNAFIFTFYEKSVTIESMGHDNQIALVMQCELK